MEFTNIIRLQQIGWVQRFGGLRVENCSNQAIARFHEMAITFRSPHWITELSGYYIVMAITEVLMIYGLQGVLNKNNSHYRIMQMSKSSFSNHEPHTSFCLVLANGRYYLLVHPVCLF